MLNKISKTRIKLQDLMQKNVGIIRNNECLNKHSRNSILKWKKVIKQLKTIT